MGLLSEPVPTRSHISWNNLATRYGCFCVQKRTEEGLAKNTQLRNWWFYAAEDLAPLRILYSTYPSDFTKAPTSSTGASGAIVGAAEAAAAAVYGTGTGIGNSLAQWWNSSEDAPAAVRSPSSATGGSGSPVAQPAASPPLFGLYTTDAAATAASASASASAVTSGGSGVGEAPVRYTVATGAHLSTILEAWGLLLTAWEPEDAELNARPSPSSPTSATRPVTPFLDRWRRTYARIRALQADTGIGHGRSSTASVDSPTPQPLATPELSLTDDSLQASVLSCDARHSTATAEGVHQRGSCGPSAASLNRRIASRHAPAPRSGSRRGGSGGGGGGVLTSWTSSLHDGRLLLRLVDLWGWRDPALTASCVLALAALYHNEAAPLARRYLCHIATSVSVAPAPAACSAATASGGRLWWGAPVVILFAFACPWTAEQQARVITASDVETLREIDLYVKWESAVPGGGDLAAASALNEGGACAAVSIASLAGVEELVSSAGTLLCVYRAPLCGLLLLHLVGAMLSWHAVAVLLLWPVLIASFIVTGVYKLVVALR